MSQSPDLPDPVTHDTHCHITLCYLIVILSIPGIFQKYWGSFSFFFLPAMMNTVFVNYILLIHLLKSVSNIKHHRKSCLKVTPGNPHCIIIHCIIFHLILTPFKILYFVIVVYGVYIQQKLLPVQSFKPVFFLFLLISYTVEKPMLYVLQMVYIDTLLSSIF